tara:strand:+ start:143 stop:379 length:237 start_codon:yes stop_codon:yes gene_type:complete
MNNYDYENRTLNGKPIWNFNSEKDVWELTTEGDIVNDEIGIQYTRCPSCILRTGSHSLYESYICKIIDSNTLLNLQME